MNKNRLTFTFIMIVIICISINFIAFSNSFDKVDLKTINDYFDYIEKIGLESPVEVGPGLNITNKNNMFNSTSTDSLENFKTITTGTATKTDNKEVIGELMTDGINQKFVITNLNGSKQYIKGWAVLQLKSGQTGWYHFDKAGNMETGFVVDSDKNQYYLIEDGMNKGMMATGELEINGHNYYFSTENGAKPYGAMIY